MRSNVVAVGLFALTACGDVMVASASPRPRLVPPLDSARLFARQPFSPQEHPIDVEAFRVHVSSNAYTARTHVELRLRNANAWQAEAVLRLPIPPGAAVTRAVLHVEGRPMEGAFLHRDRARSIYTSIVQRRRDPALVVWSGPGWVDVSIFPFAPEETRVFELEWVEPTAFDDERAWYRVPVLSHRGNPVHHPTSLVVNGRSVPVPEEGWLALGDAPSSPTAAARGPGEPYAIVLVSHGKEPSRDTVLLVADTSAEMEQADRMAQRAALERVVALLPHQASVSLAAADWDFRALANSMPPSESEQWLRALDAVRSAGILDVERMLLSACESARRLDLRTVVFVGRGHSPFVGDRDALGAPLRCFRESSIALVFVGTQEIAQPIADAAWLTGGGAVRAGSVAELLPIVLVVQRHDRTCTHGAECASSRFPLLTVLGDVRWIGRALVDPPGASAAPASDLSALWRRARSTYEPSEAFEPQGVLSPLTSMLVLESEADYQRWGIAVPLGGDAFGPGAVGNGGRGGGGSGARLGARGGSKRGDVGGTWPMVVGSLDKDLIRQVMRRNANQIRYCYESRRMHVPKLQGKVVVKFVIAASGSVATSQVVHSTVNDAGLEQCVARRVRTWSFPRPNGGVVIVTCPFIFRLADGRTTDAVAWSMEPSKADAEMEAWGRAAHAYQLRWKEALALFDSKLDAKERTLRIAQAFAAPAYMRSAELGWWLYQGHVRRSHPVGGIDALLVVASLLRDGGAPGEARRVLSEAAALDHARVQTVFQAWGLSEDSRRIATLYGR